MTFFENKKKTFIYILGLLLGFVVFFFSPK
jgi:hypothetical protein